MTRPEPRYELFPLYMIRMAGVPFDALLDLATPRTVEAARAVLAAEDALEDAAGEALDALRGDDVALDPKALQRIRTALGQQKSLPEDVAGTIPELAGYAGQHARLEALRAELDAVLEAEYEAVRERLLASAKKTLARYRPFGSKTLNQYLDTVRLRKPTAKVRNRERTLFLYMQRFCSKNDTVSEFGPSGWGTVVPGEGFRLDPEPGLSRRDAFLERWAVEAILEAMNEDPQVREELCPRIHPFVRLDGRRALRCDTGEVLELDPAEAELLSRCDSRTPAHALDAAATLERWAAGGWILWEAEPIALDPHMLDFWIEEVEGWRRVKAKRTWRRQLREAAELPRAFVHESDPELREQIMSSAGSWLQALGTRRQEGGRTLYDATNPIGEETFRECGMTVGRESIAAIESQGAPWFDLWCDCFALLAHRINGRLRDVVAATRRHGGVVPLPTFLQRSTRDGLPLTRDGLVKLGLEVFDEIRDAFRRTMEPWAHEAEHVLTRDELGFIRREFDFEPFEEFTWPSADVQIAAASTAAVDAGDCRWVIAELHPPLALMQHTMYWACPEPDRLAEGLLRTTGGEPTCYFGFGGGDVTSHTAVRLFDAVPEGCTYAAHHRGLPHWPTVRPGEVDVHVDGETGDVRMREHGTGRDLGSFTRTWGLAYGLHPFTFVRSPHTPRLLCGDVVVQRRAWVVRSDDVPGGSHPGISGSLVVAVDRMRQRLGIPRWVFIRPTPDALPRIGAKGTDKDVKPIYVDLESYPYLDVFQAWLNKYGELEVVEMMPNPEEIPWREEGGRRSFELRTLLVPAAR